MNNPNVFNWRFYLFNNPDLIQYGLTTQAQALQHWTTSGIHEGRQAHPAFDAKQYLAKYGDLAAAFGANYLAAAAHYTNNGIGEGRIGHFTKSQFAYGRVTCSSKYTGNPSSWHNPMTVSCSTKFAGAIDSIMWGNFEFINAYDHGRQAGFAWQYSSTPTGTATHPRFDSVWAEQFNPTEAGSERDAIGWNSTSKLVSSTHIAPNVLETFCGTAYWKTPAESGGCYDKQYSGDVLRKVLVLSPEGVPNLLRISSFVHPEQGNPKKAIPCRYEAPAMYINPELQHFYECNAALTALNQIPNTKHTTFSNSDMWDGNPAGGWFGSQGGEVNGVVIAFNGLSGSAGKAIGMYTVPSPAYTRISYQVYFQNYQNETTTPINNTRSMGAAVYVEDGSQYREFTTYIAVGNTPQEVMATLKLAKEQNP